MATEGRHDSNFGYVVLAARRARQLQSGSQPLIDTRSSKACRVAQDEIRAGKVTAAALPPYRVKPEIVLDQPLPDHEQDS
jgi:DNA-directed RNA polymerase subunit omega